MTVFQEMLLVARGVKPTSFFWADRDGAFVILKLSEYCQLHVIGGKWEIVKDKECFYVIVSQSKKNVVKLMRGVNRAKDAGEVHRLIGLACGYPRCCVDKYVEQLGKKPRELYREYMGKLRKGDKDPYGLELRGDGIYKYINHIPCSPYCKETKKLTKRYKSDIKKLQTLVKESWKIRG
jgi:hypothetical protein